MQNSLLQKFQQLTLAVYRVTDKFPKDEVLKKQMRKSANDLLLSSAVFSRRGVLTSSDLTKKIRRDIINKVSKLRLLFTIAREQSWVDFRNFDFLDEYCGKIYKQVVFEDFESLKTPKQQISSVNDYSANRNFISTNTGQLLSNREKTGQNIKKVNFKPEKLSERQKEFLDIVSQKERVQFSDFQATFKDISKRTIRRDLQTLFLGGFVKKNGRGPSVFYTKT